MEHRCSNRINTDIQTIIYKLGLPVAIGRVRNMSRDGVFVECAVEGFSLHEPLEIELLTSSARSSRDSRIKFFLARKERGGLALAVMDDYQPRGAARADAPTFHGIHEYLAAARSPLDRF